MRRFILSSLETTTNIAIGATLFFGLILGAIGSGGGPFGTIIGASFGFLVALVISVVVFGSIFLLMEIAENTRRTAAALEASGAGRQDQASS